MEKPCRAVQLPEQEPAIILLTPRVLTCRLAYSSSGISETDRRVVFFCLFKEPETRMHILGYYILVHGGWIRVLISFPS